MSIRLIDINLSEKEKEILDNFKISENAVFNYYGDFENLKGMYKFFHQFDTKKNSKVIKRLIKKIIKEQVTKLGKYFWLTIRITVPSHEFDLPRWHTDGTYFSDTEVNDKFLLTLKGPSTLYITDKLASDLYHKNVKYIVNSFEEYQKLRENIANLLKDFEHKQIPKYCGLIFSAQQVLHSEPVLSESRIFLSVVPGTESQINQLKKRFEG